MDYRHFELHDLLCEALIALEGKDGKALRWLEADWLATPNALGPIDTRTPTIPDDAEDED